MNALLIFYTSIKLQSIYSIGTKNKISTIVNVLRKLNWVLFAVTMSIATMMLQWNSFLINSKVDICANSSPWLLKNPL